MISLAVGCFSGFVAFYICKDSPKLAALNGVLCGFNVALALTGNGV